MTESQLARLNRAHASIKDRAGPPAEIAIMLGSGLGHLADAVEEATVIPYSEIDGFPVSTAPSHKGQLVIGRLFGRRVAVMQGRLHLYEGWSPRDIGLAVYLLNRLGASTLVVTNAAGGLNPDYRPGDVMLIEDHLNFTGVNPLVGPNDEALGPREHLVRSSPGKREKEDSIGADSAAVTEHHRRVTQDSVIVAIRARAEIVAPIPIARLSPILATTRLEMRLPPTNARAVNDRRIPVNAVDRS
jgi:purine nucleoside phosphorylase